jgi:branched-chain amino acid transport system ATP-binding protein
MTDSSAPVFSCSELRAGWGATEVLDGITFDLAAGETMAILGRNGVGKTTLLSTIMGRARYRSGDLSFNGRTLAGSAIMKRSRLGIALVPQEREIFKSLTVLENLQIARHSGGWTLAQAYNLFPRLSERQKHLGNHLSGGEQQMLAIARSLMAGPKLLMLDEPMEGLAPVIVDQIVQAVDRIRRENAIAILLVEQHASIALSLSDRVLVMERGRAVYDNGPGPGVAPDKARIETLLALSSVDAGA